MEIFRATKREINKAKKKLNVEKLSKNERKYIRLNKKIWKNYIENNSCGEILIESNAMSTSIIPFGYLANVLGKKYKSDIKAYSLNKKNIIDRIFSRKLRNIFMSFNANELHFKLTNKQLIEKEQLFLKAYHDLKSKRDVEELKIENVWIGDLLYDSHLRKYNIPTVEIKDDNFKKSLDEAIEYYIFWRDYLKSHTVKSVIVTHTVYHQNATILRIAVKNKIPCYQINATNLYYLNNDRLWAYDEFYDFPDHFKKMSPDEQKKALKISRKRLERRFSGEVGVDMRYSNKSAYKKNKKNKKIITESSRIKVLIATHCFFDNPHPYGMTLFPDVYEWLIFIGEITKKTDYDWYLKTHPDFLPGNIEILNKIIKMYPKINMIPAETSHHQIIDEGIEFALTIHGTIGFEYAALGIPVINASLCNPHIAYNFNIHPKSIDEYENILMKLSDIRINIDINEVYEYYYMRFVRNTENWLFDNYKEFINEIGDYTDQFGDPGYKKYLEEFSNRKHRSIINSLNNFVNSKDYCFQENI